MNFLTQMSKYILYVSLVLNGILLIFLTGPVSFFLYLSVVINLALVWYSVTCLITIDNLEEDTPRYISSMSGGLEHKLYSILAKIYIKTINKALKYNIISEYSMVDNGSESGEDIFDQEILDSFKTEEEKKEKEKQELREKEENERKEKLERENKIKQIQEEIEQNRIEMDKKRVEMDKLLNNN